MRNETGDVAIEPLHTVGTIVNDRYLVLEKLGEGGMSSVFRARNVENGTEVAIKFLKMLATSSLIEDKIRFRKELDLVSTLSHENIVKTFDAGEHEGVPYIVLERLEGNSLEELLERGARFAIDTAMIIIRQLVEALIYVHGQGILHRDLKPGNIFLLPRGEEYEVKLLDFGLALVMELAEIQEDEIAGTFGYMSPEAIGILHRDPDERSDLYSVGIILYRLLTGELPFGAETVGKLIHEQVALAPKRPSLRNGSIPGVLDAMVLKLLEKEPDFRYQSAKGLLHDIERFLGEGREFIPGEADQKVRLNFRTRLVGREEELHKIRKLYHAATAEQGGACFISGESGYGKSKLVETVREYVYEQEGVFFGGKCLNQENKIPYKPFKDILDIYARHVETLKGEAGEKEIARIRGVVGDFQEIVTRLDSSMEKILGGSKELVKLEPERENKRFLMVLANFFLNITEKGKPCVLFLDDLQWADEGSLNILREILGGIGSSHVLLLGTHRDDEVDEHHVLRMVLSEFQSEETPVHEMNLTPFDDGTMNRFLSSILGQTEDRTRSVTRYVLEQTEGNPFFALSVLRELVEGQALVWEDGFWKEDWEKVTNMPVPGSIIDLVLKRIKNLLPQTVGILGACSVIGQEFETDLLFRMLEEEEEHAIVSALDAAISLQFLEEGSDRGKVRFVHERVRGAFYEKLTDDERRLLHRKTGCTLEHRTESGNRKDIFTLAYHFIEAGDRAKSLEYAIPAAAAAGASYANEEALRYYLIALEILEDTGLKGGESWVAVTGSLIDVNLLIGNNDEAVAAAGELLGIEHGRIEKARLYKKIGMAYFKKGDWASCEENLVRGLLLLGEKAGMVGKGAVLSLAKEVKTHVLHSLFPSLFRFRGEKGKESDKEILRFYLVLGWMYLLSDTEKILYTFIRTINIAESRIEPSNELAIGLGGYATLCMALPLHNRAITYHERALHIRREIGNEWGTAQSFQWLGYTHSWQGDHPKSLEYFHEATEKFETIGDMWEYGQCINGLGHGYRYTGEYDRSIHYYNEYLRTSRRIQDDLGISSALASGGYALLEKGELDPARECLLEAEEVSRKNAIWFINCYANIHLGVLELECGNLDDALLRFTKAKDLYESNRFLKDYTVYIYSFLADCLLEKLKAEISSISRKERTRQLHTIKRYTKKALQHARKWPNHYGTALRVRGKYLDLSGRHRRAEKVFVRSIEQTKMIGRLHELGRAYYEYGNHFLARNRIETARHFWGQAWKIFKKIGASAGLAECGEALGFREQRERAEDDSMTKQDRFSVHRRMSTLLRVGRQLSSILDLNELLEKIMDSAMEMIGAERGMLLLYPEDGAPGPELRVSRNISTNEPGRNLAEMSGGILERLEKDRVPLIVDDALREISLKDRSSVVSQGIRSVLCAPITARGIMIGVIYLDNRMASGVFTQEDLEVLDLLGNQAGVSIANARLYTKAVTDGLTGLYNRAFFDNFLMKSLSGARRYGTNLSLLLLDVDHFKEFNDTYGHQTGDEVLRSVATTIEAQTRSSDVVCRYGGEEFVVVLTETDIEGAKITAEKVREAVEKIRVPYTKTNGQEELKVTISVGVAQLGEGQERMSIVEAADQALYEAKNAGRNRVYVSE